MKGHIDIDTLSKYFLNMLSPEEETKVQEHLRVCPECSAILKAMRSLRKGFQEDRQKENGKEVLFRILRTGWAKAAAVIILTAGISIATVDTIRNRTDVLEQHRIMNGRSMEDDVFAIDTFDKADSTYYLEKYGDDFKF